MDVDSNQQSSSIFHRWDDTHIKVVGDANDASANAQIEADRRTIAQRMDVDAVDAPDGN